MTRRTHLGNPGIARLYCGALPSTKKPALKGSNWTWKLTLTNCKRCIAARLRELDTK